MLTDSRLKLSELNTNLFAFMIEGLDYNLRGAQDIRTNAGNAEASFFIELAAWPSLHNFRINETEQTASGIFFRLISMDHDYPPIHTDLRGGQPNAVRFVHSLDHVFDYAHDLIVDLLDPPALLAKAFVRVKDYVADRHGTNE
jgi:hypothetical protein